MQRIYHKFLKESNGDYKYLRFPEIKNNHFEVMRLGIALDKLELEYTETLKAKHTRNHSGFIAY